MKKINGRVKKVDSKVISNKNKTYRIKCDSCSYIMNATIEFGEGSKCARCGSQELYYVYE
jgi:rRNA maturation endonuclease Nob1